MKCCIEYSKYVSFEYLINEYEIILKFKSNKYIIIYPT